MNDNAKEWKLVEKALYLYMSENEKNYSQKTARMYNKKSVVRREQTVVYF